jgi:hypothetical protein
MTTRVTAPTQAGINSRSRNTRPLAARHGRIGPTAMKNKSAIPIGTPRRVKYGSPTVICLFWSASTRRGNTVPVSTTSANPAKSRLFNKNAASRETAESMRPGDRSLSPRHAISPTLPNTQIPRNVNSHGPMLDCENACTELITPDRVKNVPRIVRQKVDSTSDRFQTRSIPRRSCTITEWMNAVAVSHGSSDAFSTGSHAQKPPHPSTS